MSATILLLNILSIILVTICTVMLCHHRVKDSAAKTFIACQILTINWIVCHIMDSTLQNLTLKFIFNFIGYISVSTIGVMVLLFSLYYVKSKLADNRLFKVLLFLPSVCILLVLLSDPLTHWFYQSFEVGNTVRGVGFYITAYYSYVLLAVSVVNMLRKNLKSFRTKRLQLQLISLAVVIPLLVNSISLTGLGGLEYDFTTVSFSVSSIMIFIAVYKYEFVPTSSFAIEQLLGTLKEAVMITDNKGTITFINNALRSDFDVADDVIYDNVKVVFNKIYQFLSVEQEQNIKNWLTGSSEGLDITCNNSRHYHIAKLSVMLKSRLDANVYIFTDITEYKNLIDNLSRSNSELTVANDRLVKMNVVSQNLAVEKERVRIAQELHDSLGHNLVSVMTLLKLSMIKNTDTKEEISQALSLSEGLLADIRRCVSGMKESTEISISSRIQSLINNLGSAGDYIEFSSIGEELPIHYFAGNTIYSVVREAVTNSLRHGNAKRINIILKYNENEIKGYVFDNGNGCSNISANNGLNGMREKVYALGGSIEFSSVPDDGFNISFRLPVEVNTVD